MPEQRHTAKLSSVHHWEISYAITRAFGESADDSPPIAAILQLLTDRLNWDVGALWVVNELRLVLECIEFYSPEESSFENFATVSRARRFSIGEGLPGTVWATRKVTELPDLTTGNFPRASVAALDRLQTGIAFPLHVGKRVLGVVEMFSRKRRSSDENLHDFLFALGGQIGVFLERFSAGKTLAAADAQFRLIAEAASVAVFTIDEQSTVIFANSEVERLFGYKPDELIGGKLTVVMPEYLRYVHERGLAKYVATGQRHVAWDGIPLPGLHKNGHEIALVISFGEFIRGGKRIFTGFVKAAVAASLKGQPDSLQ